MEIGMCVSYGPYSRVAGWSERSMCACRHPQGVMHTQAGYLLWTSITHRYLERRAMIVTPLLVHRDALCASPRTHPTSRLVLRYVFDLREKDVFACVADCGWITGHSYIVYGLFACICIIGRR